MDNKEKQLINLILKGEGGYANDSADRGKETYCGIASAFFPNWKGWKILKKYKPLKYNQVITTDAELVELVLEFYEEEFYNKLKIENIDYILLAGHVLDHSVNAGIKNGVKLLQKAINIVYGVNISVDGIIGNTTLSYVNGNKTKELAQEYINQRKQYYNSIVKKNSSLQKFLKGWLKRIDETTKYLNDLTL